MALLTTVMASFGNVTTFFRITSNSVADRMRCAFILSLLTGKVLDWPQSYGIVIPE